MSCFAARANLNNEGEHITEAPLLRPEKLTPIGAQHSIFEHVKVRISSRVSSVSIRRSCHAINCWEFPRLIDT